MDSSIKHLPCRLETAVRSFSQQNQIISPFLSRYCVGEWFFFCTTAWNCLCCGTFQGQLMWSERKLLFIAYTKICTSTHQIKVSKKGKQITQELCDVSFFWHFILLTLKMCFNLSAHVAIVSTSTQDMSEQVLHRIYIVISPAL